MAFPKKPEHFWPILWGVVALALAAALVLENQFGRSTAGEGPRPPAKVAEAKLLPPFRLTPEQLAGNETVERPLFVPSRRPSPPAVAGPGSIKRGLFVLQGTTIVGSLRIALLKEISSGIIHRVEMGGKVLGMTLAEVAPEQVVLQSGDDSEKLLLVVAKGAGSPAAAMEQGPFARSTAPAASAAGAPAAAGSAGPSAKPAGAADPFTGATPPSATSNRPAAPYVRLPGSATGQPETPEEMIARRRAARRVQPRN